MSTHPSDRPESFSITRLLKCRRSCLVDSPHRCETRLYRHRAHMRPLSCRTSSNEIPKLADVAVNVSKSSRIMRVVRKHHLMYAKFCLTKQCLSRIDISVIRRDHSMVRTGHYLFNQCRNYPESSSVLEATAAGSTPMVRLSPTADLFHDRQISRCIGTNLGISRRPGKKGTPSSNNVAAPVK